MRLGSAWTRNGQPKNQNTLGRTAVVNLISGMFQCEDFSATFCSRLLLSQFRFRRFAQRSRASGRTQVGALVIAGGGEIPEAVRDKFMSLAGGKAAKLVVVPTASEAADRKEEEPGYLEPWRRYSPARLSLLHTRSRKEADDLAFARPIAEATAVWFSGGDQAKLVTPYRDTAVEREFHALLARGGVIGGTSAGAAVMSDVMIEGGNPRPQVGRGFRFVTNAVVDQHFLRRNRVNRLLSVLAERPHLIGLGIDEGTALDYPW